MRSQGILTARGQTGFHLTKIPNCWVICNYLPYSLSQVFVCFVLSSGSHNRHPLTRSQISTCQAKLRIAHQVTLQPSGPTVRADRVHLKSRFLIKAFSSVPDSSLGFSSSTSHFGFINSRLRALLWSPNKLQASLGIKSVCKYPWDMSSPSLPGLCLVGTEGAGGGPAPLCLPPPHCSCPC